MVCTETCPGHRGSPGPTFLVLQKQSGGCQRKGHQGCKSSAWGVRRDFSRDEGKKMFSRVQRQLH